MSLLQMSFAGGVMILAVTVIRALAINLLPKKTFGALWGIVVARLLIPISVPAAFSVYSLLCGHTSAIGTAENPQATQILTVGTTGQLGGISKDVPVWTVIWVIGMSACALFFAIAYRRCRQEFRTSLPVDNDFIRNWLNAHRQRREISIRQSDRFSAPLTYGIFRPVILMPTSTEWENTESLQYVLAHEYVHIRRFDSVMKLMLVAALCAHWFNPLVWAMYILANRDIELSCDETVVHLFGESSKAAYARVLISMEETQSGLTPLCNNFSKNAIEERITAIMKIKKKTIGSFVLAGFIVAGTATAFATSANAQSQQAASVEQDGKIEIAFKPDTIPQVTENAGAFFKEDGKIAGTDTNDAPMAVPVQSDEIHGVPVDKTGADDLPKSNVVYFHTEAERDEHFRALEANTERGLNRYAGFEEMYEGIDTSAPVTYIVK